MKNILNEVISKLNSEKDGYCRITHKKGWLGFLEDGDMIFKPHGLRKILKETIKREGMEPRGTKLFFLKKRGNFTVTSNKKPYRTEEALERFITASNPDNFFNQIPIGGGKESIDIGIRENESKFIFVELKPWSSTNSPLYAIVESLKNLIEYRIIHEERIKEIEQYREVDLLVLAPWSYYRSYGLIDIPEDKISLVKKALNDLSSEFNTNISLMELPLEKKEFFDICRRICDNKKITKQQSIFISSANSIPELERRRWRILVEG